MRMKSVLAACLWMAACGGDDGGNNGNVADDGKTQGNFDGGASPTQRGDSATASHQDAQTSGGGTTTGNPGGDAGGRTTSDAAVAATSDASTTRPGWKLVWSDEFDGTSGSSPSNERWVFETGGGGFGNNELETYTSDAKNASLDGNGMLVIRARNDDGKITSARMKTAGKFEHTYGRYEARLRIPKGQGMWPAFWMLGANIGSDGWPKCGEIDIMENIGKEPTTVHGTIHGPNYSGGDAIGAPYQLANKAPFSDDFHVFAVEWEKDVIRWYVDDTLYETHVPADLKGKTWVYDHPFFILLNLAVGGQWPGNPDKTTVYPQTLTVDYVRVYDRE